MPDAADGSDTAPTVELPEAAPEAAAGGTGADGGDDTQESDVDKALLGGRPSGPALIIGFALVVVGAVGGRVVIFNWIRPAVYTPKTDWVTFGGLFVVAQAIERLLEPFSGYILPPPGAAKPNRDASAAVARANPTPENARAAAADQATLDNHRASRAVIMWGLASMLAMWACGAFGFFLLRSMDANPGSDPVRLLDLVATGLVVGAGTKPLHDLIGRLQKTSGS